MSGDERPSTRRVSSGRSVVRTDRGRRHPLERDIDIRERRLQLLLGFIGLLMLPLAIAPGIVIWASQDDAPAPVITMVNATTDTASPPVTRSPRRWAATTSTRSSRTGTSRAARTRAASPSRRAPRPAANSC